MWDNTVTVADRRHDAPAERTRLSAEPAFALAPRASAKGVFVPPPWPVESGLLTEGVRLSENSGDAHSLPAKLTGLSLTADTDIDGLRHSSLRSRYISCTCRRIGFTYSTLLSRGAPMPGRQLECNILAMKAQSLFYARRDRATLGSQVVPRHQLKARKVQARSHRLTLAPPRATATTESQVPARFHQHLPSPLRPPFLPVLPCGSSLVALPS